MIQSPFWMWHWKFSVASRIIDIRVCKYHHVLVLSLKTRTQLDETWWDMTRHDETWFDRCSSSQQSDLECAVNTARIKTKRTLKWHYVKSWNYLVSWLVQSHTNKVKSFHRSYIESVMDQLIVFNRLHPPQQVETWLNDCIW